MNTLTPSDGNANARFLTPGAAGISRRQFLTGSAGLLGAATLLGGELTAGHLLGMQIAHAQTPALRSDLDILQFALGLEYLETSTYNLVNSNKLLSGQAAQYAQKFGDNENVHVATIVQAIQALGGTPIKPPDVFNLPAFNNETDIVMFLIASEEVGAGAYLGTAPLIQSKEILATGAKLMNVEGQHATGFKMLLRDPNPAPAFAPPLTVEQVVTAAKNAYGPNALTSGSGKSPSIIIGNNPPTGPVPYPGGSQVAGTVGTGDTGGTSTGGTSTGGAPGMPRTGQADPLWSWTLAAGLAAVAVGAALHIRSRQMDPPATPDDRPA